MSPSLVLRLLALAALLGAAFTAQAVDAFSNLDPAPSAYSVGGYNIVDFGNLNVSQGWQFMTMASGLLSGFQVAMNNHNPADGMASFVLTLYSDNGLDKLGTLLGTYNALSTGVAAGTATNDLASVAVSGPDVLIATGTKYWLVASAQGHLLEWNGTNSNALHPKVDQVGALPLNYSPAPYAAFSVQVTPVPEPATLAALGLGAVGLLRKRRR